MKDIAWDSETELFGEGNMLPKLICASFATRGDDGEMESELYGNTEEEDVEGKLAYMLTNESLRLITHNGGYDYGVAIANYPALIPLVFDAMFSGRLTDTLWREKLINLSTTGKLTEMEMPDGTSVRISYSLSALELRRLGVDRSEQKEGEDIWRMAYGTLDGVPAVDYPEEAARYATDDAVLTLLVYESQEDQLEANPSASTGTESFCLMKSFILMLMTAWGMEVNQKKTDEMETAVLQVLDDNKDLLISSGILRGDNLVGPPKKKYFEQACGMLPAEYEKNMDWNPYADAMKKAGIEFCKPSAKPGSKNVKVLQKYVAALYKELGEIPTETPAGAVCLDAEVKGYLADKDPVMNQLYKREQLGKLVSQMIPALRSGKIVHPSYDALKETGRTSSYDGGKAPKGGDGVRKYPSVNIQQIPNEIGGRFDPRQCFKPRDGRVFIDVDVSNLELACTGFVTDDLFGHSVHLKRYNAGCDLHAYLGTMLALGETTGLAGEFAQGCRSEGIISDPMACYVAMMDLKHHNDKSVKAFFKKYRNFAKPVGLGFPGGLGPDTMVDFARKTYGVKLTRDQAANYKDLWLETYPEMVEFFEWVNQQVDEYNVGGKSKFGRPEVLYQYCSTLGMKRVGTSFCAEANGVCMQTPGAEAVLTGTAFISRACYDPTQESVLLGCRPIAFVHDQIIAETTTDQSLWAAQCEEAARLLRHGIELVMPTVKIRTDEAMLTTAWTKTAEPVRDESGQLIPYVPSN